MLHMDALIRLCHARDLLRADEERLRTIPEVAREVGMSTFHFVRLFGAVFGQSPKQCQLQARLERAKNLLLTTDHSVTDIAFESGFASLGTFTHVFAERVGLPPSRYRYSVRRLTEPQRIPGCFSLMGEIRKI